MPHGGARPRSGPKKGAKYRPTITKEAAREALRQIVLKHMDDMVSAQVAASKGLKYLVARGKSGGKFETVTREQVDQGILERDDVLIEVWDKQPSTPAFTDLMNRALDKPKEQEQTINVNVNELDARIEVGRKRIVSARAGK
jgi:hypothetical protein